MQITVVAVMCHVVGAVVAEGVGTLPEAVCREGDCDQAGHANAGLHASQPARERTRASIPTVDVPHIRRPRSAT
jgi:hypothetical protein